MSVGPHAEKKKKEWVRQSDKRFKEWINLYGEKRLIAAGILTVLCLAVLLMILGVALFERTQSPNTPQYLTPQHETTHDFTSL